MIIQIPSLKFHSPTPHTPSLAPPSPHLIEQLMEEFKDNQNKPNQNLGSFWDYFKTRILDQRDPSLVGIDNFSTSLSYPNAIQKQHLIVKPKQPLKNTIPTLVLLAEFKDKKLQSKTIDDYQDFFFGNQNSLKSYYKAISNGKIDIDGLIYPEIIQLDKNMRYYANSNHGVGKESPNIQTMARATINKAINGTPKLATLAKEKGIDLSKYVVKKNKKHITAVVIIHAGQGAEITENENHLWSVKWVLKRPSISMPLHTGKKVKFNTFMTVPEDCSIGVCAHEWGHVAAEWNDFYDTDPPGARSSGLGEFCLMAYGNWAHNGTPGTQPGDTPTLPNGMLRSFHKWIDIIKIIQKTDAQLSDPIRLKPASEGGQLLALRHPQKMHKEQWIYVEYRRQTGYDTHLPDQGIAIYAVDETIPNVNNHTRLAIKLLQADGQGHLTRFYSNGQNSGNNGDSGDLYPHDQNKKAGQNTSPPLNIPNAINENPKTIWSGITIEILNEAGNDHMDIKVKFD